MISDNLSAQEIISNLTLLRNDQRCKSDFFSEFLTYFLALCKADRGLILEKTNNQYEVISKIGCENDFAELAKNLIPKAIDKGFTFERYRLGNSTHGLPVVIVCKLLNIDCFVVFLADKANASFNEILVRTQLVSDIPYFYYQNINKKSLEVVAPSASHNNIIEMFGILMDKSSFKLTAITIVNEIAARYNCSQVSLGWTKFGSFKTIAISKIDTFDKNSEIVELLEDLFQEAVSLREIIFYPDEKSNLIYFKAKKYFENKQITQLVAIPMLEDGEVVGVLCCEKSNENFIDKNVIEIQLIANQITPWFSSLEFKQKNIFSKIFFSICKFTGNYFNIRFSFFKFFFFLAIIALLISFFYKIDYEVEAQTTLETDHISHISAPFDGIIKNVYVNEGDHVKENQLLCSFDNNELQLKANEQLSEISKYSFEIQKHRSEENLADMKIAQSKFIEAKTVLQRMNYYISKSYVRSPFDGIVVESDKKNLLGRPFGKGDIIMKIAKIGNSHLKIKIPESQIDEISYDGRFVFLNNPDKIYKIKVTKIIPVAEVDQNSGNVFVLYGVFLAPQESWWRPGMNGVSKIYVGQKTLFWIATHKISDFIKMHIWW